MKIGIDVRLWAESGLGRYIRNLVQELIQLDSKNQYVLFGLSKDKEQICRVIENSNRWCFVEADYKWYGLAEQLLFPIKIYAEHVDLIHFPHFNIPVLYFRKFIVTIHDLTHFDFSMIRATTLHPILYKIKHTAYTFAFRQAVRRSETVMCVSQYVAKQLSERFRVSESKIQVSYEACDVHSILKTDKASVSIPGPYFFYVGNVHPHKNIEFLLRAFSQFLKEYPDHYLVLSGKDNYFWQQLRSYAAENHLDAHVIYTGYVHDSELADLYSHARAYIFPSLSEGFGLPLLEAMTHSCPVLSSNATSLPEIGGNAALYFDPTIENSLISQMKRITGDETLRTEAIRNGLSRVQQFSWKKMAEDTLAAYLR